jgi:hypothetical protein
MNSVLDDALDRLHASGPALRDGAPNHGPMVVETLMSLDCSDLVPGWLDHYRGQLEPASVPRAPISVDAWDQALGARDRFADWVAFFNTQLSEAPWQVALMDWLPRLMPGVEAYGTHGLIRTAHAAHALAQSETLPRLRELAAGLGTWAAYYQRLPGVPRLAGTRDVVRSIDALPRLPANAERHGPPPRVVRGLDDLPSFPSGVDSLAAPTNVGASLSELSEAGARLYFAHAERHPLVFVHAVTAPAALRTLLPHIRNEDQVSAFASIWQAVAASASAFGRTSIDGALPPDADELKPIAADNVKERSLDTQDTHAIKFFDACRREAELNPTPVYLRAANDWAGRLLEARTWSHAQRIAAGLSAI